MSKKKEDITTKETVTADIDGKSVEIPKDHLPDSVLVPEKESVTVKADFDMTSGDFNPGDIIKNSKGKKFKVFWVQDYTEKTILKVKPVV